jgi:hypothetical protein
MGVTTKTPVFWNGQLIGHIENIKGENFDLYGKWLPQNDSATKAFLDTLERQDEVLVEVGEKKPTLGGISTESFYLDEVNIKIRQRK